MRKHWYSEKKNRVIATIETSWRGWENWGFGVSVTCHDCPDPNNTTLCLKLGFIYIWLGIGWGINIEGYYARETGIEVYSLGGDIVFTGNIWHTDGMWESGTPWYRHFYLNVKDFLFGQWESVEKILEAFQGEWIDPMDGKTYAAEYRLVQFRQRRRRMPGLERMFHRMELDLGDVGAPFPGKGENSWDCGEDAMFSTSIGIGPEPVPRDWAQAVRDGFTAAVQKKRLNYGGKNWKPAGA